MKWKQQPVCRSAAVTLVMTWLLMVLLSALFGFAAGMLVVTVEFELWPFLLTVSLSAIAAIVIGLGCFTIGLGLLVRRTASLVAAPHCRD